MNKKIAIYPGSFDPITYGHLDVVDRAVHLFDHLIITITTHRDKEPLFGLDERLEMIRTCSVDYENVEVTSYDGLIVDFAREKGACALIRGLRFVSDIEFEFQLAWVNRHLNRDVNTVFLMTDAKYTHLSSTVIREAAELGADIDSYVPPAVVERLHEKFGK